MKIQIAGNIRSFRKERKLTQEQLAEALGVTVGAVSKWESGASMPEVGLIVEMASLFETSVDVLLGYEWHSGCLEQALEQMVALRNEKRFDEAAALAEKTLQKFPNNFDAAFRSAVMYSMKGVEQRCNKSFRRALALFERSLELIGQNTDEQVNQWTIRNHIADVYLALDQPENALEQMRRNNAGGLNNASIGCVLAMALRKPDEALVSLSDALIDHVTTLFRVAVGYANAYGDKHDYDSAIAVLLWMRGVIGGLKQPGAPSYHDREEILLLSACASMSVMKGDAAGAKDYLRQAKSLAKRFDADPAFSFAGARFFHSKHKWTAFDDFGASAQEGIRQTLAGLDGEAANAAWRLWEAVEQENSQGAAPSAQATTPLP